MPWRKQVEQWRQYVIWESGGIPPDLILSIINNESGGQAGVPAGVRTKFARELPLRTGGTELVDRAYGLMQCVPVVIEDYNKAHPKEPVYFDDMKGRTADAGRLQIRVGTWLFNKMIRRLSDFFPESFPARTASDADPEQLSAALVAYARGMGALKKKFELLKQKGVSLTQRNLYEHFPLWGFDKVKRKWINRPLYYAAKVWRGYQRNKTNEPGTGPPENPSGQPQTAIAKAPKKKMEIDTDLGIPILLLVGAFVASKFFGEK